MKKTLFTWTLILLVLAAFSGVTFAEGSNLAVNSGFEENSGGLPAAWSIDEWEGADSAAIFLMEAGGMDGGTCLSIENPTENDARMVQQIDVEPNSLYRISAYVKTEGRVEGGTAGANVSVIGTVAISSGVLEAKEWKKVEMYGRTGSAQKTMSVGVRLGGYYQNAVGKAYFDQVEVVKVDQAPAGVTVQNVEIQQTSSDDEAAASTATPTGTRMKVLLFAIVYAVLFYGLYRWLRKARDPFETEEGLKREKMLIAFLMVAAVVLRLAIGYFHSGLEFDLNCFTSWSRTAYEGGPANLYDYSQYLERACDYPPGYLYVLYILGWIASLLHLEAGTPAMILLMKLPSIITDMILGVMIYRIARKHLKGQSALVLAALYLLNPAVILNSSAWGQVDGFFTLFLILCTYYAATKRLTWAALFYTIALLVKPQAIMFAPILLFPFIHSFLGKDADRRKALKTLLISVGLSLVVFIALSLPFIIKQDSPLAFLYNQYVGTVGQYTYSTLNAFNFYALIGCNYLHMDALPVTVLTVLAVVSVMVFVSYLYFKRRKYSSVFMVGAVLISWMYTLAPMMHERYLFPLLAFLVGAYVVHRDRRLLIALGLSSILHYLNTVMILSMYPSVLAGDAWVYIIAFGQVAMFFYIMYVALDIFAFRANKKPLAPEPLDNADGDIHRRIFDAPAGIRTTRREMLVVAALTVIYAAIALINLGDTIAPATYWEPKAYDSVSVELQSDEPVQRVYYYAGVGKGSLRLEGSEDGTSWFLLTELEHNMGDMFKWLYEDVNADCRYVRVTALDAGQPIYEMAFLNGGQQPLPLTVTASTDGKGESLFDEQSVVPLKPTYMNSMYFDEIYHARTAYEQLHDLSIYENTHPPLGKTLIALGVSLFGMTPFGWRIVGTVFGILMVPVFYALARAILKKHRYALFSTVLFTFDLMHFAQTRISTIDVYAVFFIMLMYLFMFKYMQLSYNREPLKKTLLPLALSGIIFGIGCASKWIVIYGGGGLALLFLYTLYQRYQEYNYALKRLGIQVQEGANFFVPFNRYTFMTTAAIVLVSIASVLYGIIEALKPYMGDAAALEAGGISPWIFIGVGGMIMIAAYIFAWRCCQKDRAYLAKYYPDATGQLIRLRSIVLDYKLNTLRTLGFCIIFFVLVPVGIYALSYLPLIRIPGYDASYILSNQTSMFNYHGGLTADHPFQSPWYQWPLMLRPIWFYQGKLMDSGMVSSIVSLGNPLVWWSGFVAFAMLVVKSIRKKRISNGVWVMLVGFAFQFLPWVMVSRVTFIYHYFASLPFVVLALGYAYKQWDEDREPNSWRWTLPFTIGLGAVTGCLAYSVLKIFVTMNLTVTIITLVAFMFAGILAVGALYRYGFMNKDPLIQHKRMNYVMVTFVVMVIALFAMFYPVVSGMDMTKGYMEFIRWLPSWTFG